MNRYDPIVVRNAVEMDDRVALRSLSVYTDAPRDVSYSDEASRREDVAVEQEPAIALSPVE